MRSDIVTIEPQIVQFGRQNSQTIKVINNTSNTITNFFFCLYNTQKFTFSPDSFSLAPNEHKLITISIKIKSVRSVAKQFAYLKSTEINKRITLLINQFQSPEIKNRPFEEGMEDINTLSSRQYRDVQTQAIQKIIKEKQAYIALLEKNNEGINRNINFRTEQSGEKIGLVRRQVEQLQVKLVLTQNQRQSLLKQNTILQNKFEQYRKYCQNDLRNYEKITHEYKQKLQENRKLIQEVGYLQQQGTQFLKKIQQKQQKIRQLQFINRKVIDQSKKQVQKKVKYVEDRLQQQKNIYQQSARYSEDKIKDLQKKIQFGQSLKQKNVYFERQLKRKQQQIKNLMGAIQTQRSNMKEIQAQKKKLIKFQLLNESVNQKNSELTSRLKQVQKLNQTLKEQIYVYKNRMSQTQNSSDKMNQYLQIALQSCRAQNQALKRTKHQLQKSLDDFMHLNRQSHDNNKSLTDQISKYKEQVNLLIEIKDNLERRNEELKQQHHLAIMHLKTENIQLLQKLSLGQTSKREDKLRRLEEEFQIKDKELLRVTFLLNQHNTRNQELLIENAKLGERVKKYKKQAKKQLRSINDTAINQLHKEHEQKKQMAKRIIQLEEVILNYSCDKFRQEKSKKYDEREMQTQLNLDNQTMLRRERASSRMLGIKDQRRQIQYSQGSNIDAFSELGQLRQLNNYIKNEEDRFNKLFSFDDKTENQQNQRNQRKTDEKPIFRVIKFFKNLENKLRESKGDQDLVNIKQIQYLKGRIKQLEGIKQQKQNVSSINLSKTRQHCSELLQFVREQMKNQYKKLNETVKLWQQKYDLLKKKIFEQYRSKIIQVLNKKQKSTFSQLQTILQRFIDGMSNLSHKEAILHKQVKLKQNARKQNVELKQKVTQLNYLLQTKKGYCSRDPIKLLYNETELEWQESLKRQAEFLTLTAEYQRIKEELELVSQELDDSRQQAKRYLKQLDQKSNEVLRLKKYQIQIQSNYEREIQKQYQIIEENKKRIMEVTKTSKETIKHLSKQKQYNNLRDNLQKQKEVIRQLRDKQKMMEELLQESHRSEQKERKKINEQNRVVETMRDLKENNRQLRNENAKIKQKVGKLQQELEKKNAYLKSLREDLQQNRVRVQKKEEVEAQKLKEEVKRLHQQLKKIRDELEKCKRKKEKEVSQLKNQIDKLKNQNLITEKSLQSIIRALMDTIRKIYGRLKRLIKKRKGKDLEDNQKLFENTQGLHINALKIDQIFEEALTVFEQND